MTAALKALAVGAAGMSVLTVIVLLLAPLLSVRYRQRTVYMLLIICLVGFLIPWRPVIPRAAVTVSVPAAVTRQLGLPVERTGTRVTAETDTASMPSGEAETRTIQAVRPVVRWSAVLFLLWAAGAVAVLAVGLGRYARFCRLLKRWRGTPDAEAAALLAEETQASGIRRIPRLYTAPCVSGPLVAGLFRPAIYLPDGAMPEADRRLILRHELTHLRQGDLVVKWLTLPACAVHWFNPVVWLLRKAINQYCELSCDERVMRDSDLRERERYSETIIAAIRVSSKTPTVLCTAFQGGLKRMKRRITRIMDTHQKRIGVLALTVVLAVTVLSGGLFGFTSADALDRLPEMSADYEYQYEPVEEFAIAYPGVTSGSAAPVYNAPDDPEWPSAFYAPGIALEITGRKWRAEHIEGVTGSGGMIWLRVNMLEGEQLKNVWIPEVFVTVGDQSGAVRNAPEVTLKVPEEKAYISIYARLTDQAPVRTLLSERTAELINWQPSWVQVRLGTFTGYVEESETLLDPEAAVLFHPGWAQGFDSWRAGYAALYEQYLEWFEGMENQYGSFDMWPNEVKAVATQVQRGYGLLQDGDTAFALPEEGDISEQEAIGIGRRLIGDDGGTDELGVPWYAWQAYFQYTVGQDAEPCWQLRAWPSHTDMDRMNLRLTRTGELMGEIVPYRDYTNPSVIYSEIALALIYGEMRSLWPSEVRTAFDPVQFPPLREDWASEEEIRRIAIEAVEAAFGAEKRVLVEAEFTVFSSWFNYGRSSEDDPEDSIFWTVRYVNTAPGEVEEIQVHINMDGTLRNEPVDDFYGEAENYTLGGNG